MTKPDTPTLSDFLSLGQSALSALLGTISESKLQCHQNNPDPTEHMPHISREEFDAMWAMIRKAREIQEEMSVRLHELEEKMNLSSLEKQQQKNKSDQ